MLESVYILVLETRARDGLRVRIPLRVQYMASSSNGKTSACKAEVVGPIPTEASDP